MNLNFLKKLSPGWKFFLIVLLLYIILFFTKQSLTLKSLASSLKIIYIILPILVLVFLLIYLFNLLLDAQKISKYLGEDIGLKKYFFVVILGILSSGPIYMWYPLLADLRDKGMNNGLIATFLYNRAIKLPLLPLMIAYFSLKLVIILMVLTIIFSLINGSIINKLIKEKI